MTKVTETTMTMEEAINILKKEGISVGEVRNFSLEVLQDEEMEEYNAFLDAREAECKWWTYQEEAFFSKGDK